MIVTRAIPIRKMLNLSWHHLLWLFLVMGGFAWLYSSGKLEFRIPWLPISVIGTAVAFYVGFKNNQSYGRMWEARKIWGGIVNDSRTWGSMVDSYLGRQRATETLSAEQLHDIKRRLIYRHLAWLYAHRSQLLIHAPWEHAEQKGTIGIFARKLQDNYGVGLLQNDVRMDDLHRFLEESEFKRIVAAKNTATQLINAQMQDLTELNERGLINDFRHVEMGDVLRTFYALQGKNERIKKFPLPRQYATMSRYFVGIFISLLPFSMIPELMDSSSWGAWLAVPVTMLIGWVYVMMEVVGDYSENPFQGMANDIPMLSLCRVIEIDLREMLGEKDLPPSIEAQRGILM